MAKELLIANYKYLVAVIERDPTSMELQKVVTRNNALKGKLQKLRRKLRYHQEDIMAANVSKLACSSMTTYMAGTMTEPNGVLHFLIR